MGGEAEQAGVPADTDRARAELQPALVVDVGDVLQFEPGAPVALGVSRTSIQETSSPYSQVAEKLLGGSQRWITPPALPSNW